MVIGKPSSWWMLQRWAKLTRVKHRSKESQGEHPITRKFRVFKTVDKCYKARANELETRVGARGQCTYGTVQVLAFLMRARMTVISIYLLLYQFVASHLIHVWGATYTGRGHRQERGC